MLSGVAMVGAFVAIMLNILARIFLWNLPGLDGYAGYAIAAALFLALPATLQNNEHIRATLAARSRQRRLARRHGMAVA